MTPAMRSWRRSRRGTFCPRTYRENFDEAKEAMLDAFAELKGDPEQASGILDDLEWFGVNSFGDRAVAGVLAPPPCHWVKRRSARVSLTPRRPELYRLQEVKRASLGKHIIPDEAGRPVRMT